MLKTRISVDEFMEIALAPENEDRRLERIDGEIIEVVSNNKASEIASTIAGEMYVFAKPRKLGRVTSSDGGYTINGEQYIPDCAFVSYQRQPHSTTESYPAVAPEIVVEVISPANIRTTNDHARLTRKVANYLAAGCEVWLIYPEEEELERYIAGEPVRTYRTGEILEGRGILEGFHLEISAIWPR